MASTGIEARGYRSSSLIVDFHLPSSLSFRAFLLPLTKRPTNPAINCSRSTYFQNRAHILYSTATSLLVNSFKKVWTFGKTYGTSRGRDVSHRQRCQCNSMFVDTALLFVCLVVYGYVPIPTCSLTLPFLFQKTRTGIFYMGVG